MQYLLWNVPLEAEHKKHMILQGTVNQEQFFLIYRCKNVKRMLTFLKYYCCFERIYMPWKYMQIGNF